MSQTSIQPAARNRGRARRRWLPTTAVCALLGIAGALLGSSCGRERRCFSEERCEPCPGHCLEDEVVDTLGVAATHIVWVGKQGEEPSCEEYGLEHELDWWLDLQDDPSCPPCRCERDDCAGGSVRFRRSADSCEEADEYRGEWHLYPPWDVCEPMEDYVTSSVTVPWYDVLPACTSRDDLFQPGATWKRKARSCWARQPREYSCGSNPNVPTCLVDPRVLSDGFRLCAAVNVTNNPAEPSITDAPCPPELPEKLDMYRWVSGCGTCDCESDGELCSMEFSFYRDQACSELLLTHTPTTESVCIDLAEPAAMGGIKLRLLAEGHGDCIDRGRVGLGEKIEPGWGQTFCCKPLGG
ncbi:MULTISPECIES: hypothetical protein [Sorangium]|uniref:Uncharacterized protein n=1 Tax=Sorangium cellulosum TaxID=56 RepID=A0A4P2R117_SORCE|nr:MULTISPECIES: hypothetical protein [Sorangium]AUX36221.1 uncharacterized protein SOCE836_084280 [Sorangium cellulosum]WCQ95523.1 hypothetical protein NQZ70_08300 [Sorangium sp. Soce836]